MKIYICLLAILFQPGSAINPCIFDCAGFADGRYPDCSSCATYHACFNGQITTQNCAAGSLYDVISETCQPQAQTVCGTDLNSIPTDCTTDCSNVGTGQFPYCGDCGKSIVCYNGTVVQQLQCPNNDVYNLLFLSCTSLNGAVCGYNPLLPIEGDLNNIQTVPAGFQTALADFQDQMSPNDARVSSVTVGTSCTSDCKDVSQNGIFPFCGSCSEFVICIGNNIFRRISCPSNLRFDAVNLKCDLESVAVCGAPAEMTTIAPSSRVTPSKFIITDCIKDSCSELPGNGIYPICNMCDKSVLCFGGLPIRNMCNKGLLYDAVTKRCTFPRFASCAISKSATSPATSPITSPATSPATSPITSPATSPVTSPATSPLTSPATSPVTSPATSPVTSPATSPATSPITSPATSPVTSPATSPVTSPATSPKTSPATSPVTSPTTTPITSPITSPSTGITPKKKVETKCSTDCSNIYGVRYVPVCDDCSRGLFCAYGRIRSIIRCPFGFLYDFITRTCKRPEFTTCGIGEPDEEPTTTTTRPDSSCIRTCHGRPNGFYHSCFGCRYYARCFNGLLNVGICPNIIGLPLFWDDSVKNCVIRSSTCRAIGK